VSPALSGLPPKSLRGKDVGSEVAATGWPSIRTATRLIVVSRRFRRLRAVVVTLLGAASLSNCRLDDLLSPGEFGTLDVTPIELQDSARVGSMAARITTAELQITGPGTLLNFRVQAEGGSPWLTLSDTTGSAPGTYSISLNPEGLGVGEYLDTLRFTADGPEEEPVRVGVRFRVLPCAVTDLGAIPSSTADALTTADCVSAQHPERYARRFSFSGTAGDSVTINMTSGAIGGAISLWAAGGATPIAESTSCQATGTGACVRYILLPATGVYQVEATSTDDRATGAFSLTVGRPRTPDAPTTLDQRTAELAATAIAVGAMHDATTLSLRGALTDPDLDSLRMEIEIRRTFNPFTGVATATSALGRGPAFAVSVAGLLDNSTYHWRARAVDVTGRTSAWVAFGGNAAGATDVAIAVPEAPAAPTSLTQRRSDGVTTIPAGGTTDETVVNLGGAITDPDPGDQVRLEVELKPVGTPFTNTASASSALLASGSSALVTVAGLDDDVAYRWQARTVDGTGRASAWVSLSPSGADLNTSLPAAQVAVTVEPVSTAAGAVITPSVRIAAQDAAGNTLTSFTGNISIALGSNPTGATLGGTTTVAAVDGVATFTDLTITQVGAGYTLVATSGVLTATTVPFNITASAAGSLEVGAVPASVVAGEAIAPAVTITVRDGFGNVATDFTGSVSLALTPNGAGAALLGTTSVNAVAGVATFADVRVERAATGLTFIASSTGLPNATGGSLTVTNAGAASLRIATQPAAFGASGAALAPQPAIVIEDAFGNAVIGAGTTVTVSIASGPGGGILAGASANTDAAGVVTFSTLAITGTSGSYTLSFASGALPVVTSTSITLGIGAATQLDLVTDPSSAAANGAVLDVGPVVQLRDGAGNAVTAAGVSVTAAITSGGGVLSGTTTVLTSATGEAIFTDLAITGLVGPRTLTFTSSGLTSTSFGPINVSAGAATQIAVNAGNGQSATAGSAVAIAPSVIATDMSGNPVAGVSVTFAVASGGGSIVPPGASITDVNGVATLTSWTLGAAVGANTVTAESDGLDGSPVTFTATATAGVASMLTITAGQDLSGPVGTTLGTAHEVRVTDANGNPVAGVPIEWTAVGGGSVAPPSNVTDADGRAEAVRTLGGTAGTSNQTTTASATLSGGPATVTFNLAATVGGASQMAMVAGDAQADTVGATLATPLTVVVRDALNNPVEGVLITWAVVDGGGSVFPTSAPTDASGIATTAWTLGTITTPTDSTQLARASGVGTPVSFFATSRPGAVSATQTLVNVAPASIAASRTTPATVTVTARDGFGNPIPNRVVTLAATGSGNTIVQPAAPTNASGVTTGAIGATVIGARTITATVSGVVATQQPTLTVIAAPAFRLVFTVPPADVIAGTAFTTSPAIGALDSLDNPIATYGGMVTLAIGTNPGGAALSGTLGRNAVAGTATFPGLSLNRAAAGYTLTATANGVAAATSAPFNVTAGGVAVASSSISALPGTISAGGAPATITVTARDANLNPVAGATVVLGATGLGNDLTQPLTVTNANGEATGSLASTATGAKTISATINGIALPTTTAVTVTPAVVSGTTSTIDAAPGSIIAGGATSTITVTARDEFGNLVPGATVVLAASGSGNSVTQPVAVTDANGVATGTVSSTVAEAKVISATVDGIGLATTANVTVTPGAISAATSTVSAAPGTITAGGAGSTITVTARDANGNPIAGATVVISASGAGNTVTQPVAVTNASGVATGTVASTIAATKTISATIGGIAVTQTASVVVEAGAVSAATSTVEASPTSIAAGGGSSTITVTARDASGNLIAGATVVLEVSGIGNSVTQPAAVTDANGVATGSVASTAAGAKTVSATIDAVPITQTANVNVTSGAVSASLSTISALPTTLVAGGGSSTVTVTARDVNSNPVAGATVILSATGSGNSFTQPAVTDVNGVATGSFSSTATGPKEISATIDGVPITQTAGVTITPGAVSAAQSTVSAAPSSITAGGAATTITVSARDANGNVVPGATVVLAASGTGNTLTQPVAITDVNGVATGTLASTIAQSKTVSASIDGVPVTEVANVSVTPAAISAARSLLQVDNAIISAAVGSTTVAITVRDEFDNPIPGVLVELAATGSGNTLTQPAGATGADGVTTGVFSSTVSEAKVISATAGGVGIVQTAGVTVVPDAVSASNSTVGAAPTTITAGGSGSTITVTARDGSGNPVAGVTVVLSSTGIGNVITQPAAVTNASGVATGTLTSTTAGAKTVSASVNGVSITQTVVVTVNPGAISDAQSLVSAAPGSIVAGGAASTITVTARDANGNPISGATVVLAASGSSNTLTQPVAVTDVNGVATGSVASTVAESKTISATINGIGIVQTAIVAVTPGAISPDQSSVQVAPVSIVAGGATSTITVTARDANNNVVSGATVVLAAGGAGNTLTQPVAVTNASGVATGTLASTVAEVKLISATAGGVELTQTPVVTVTPGAVSAAQSTVTANPATVTAGGAGSTITVTARDANGNLIPDATVVLAANGSGNTVTQPAAVTDANGVATGTVASTVAEVKTVSATIAGVPITQTAAVTVNPGAVSAATSTVSADPTTLTAGAGSSTITVTARDANSNPISGATVVLAATGTGNTLTQPAGNSNGSGVATGAFSSTGAAAKTISATINGIGIVQTATITVNAAAASAAQSTVSASPTTITAGGAGSTITVTARDASGNPVPGLAVVLSATGSTNTLTQPVAVTDANGVATGTLASTVAESKTVSATVDAVPITQTATVTVNPGAVSAALSTVSALPTTIVAGGAGSTITVTARDANGNLIPGATVVLAATGTGNSITQPAAVTDANGVATGTVASTVAEAKTVSATIGGVGVTQTAALTVNPGAVSAATSTVSAAPGSISADGGTSTITVTARDANSNVIGGATVVLAATGSDYTLTQPVGTTNGSGVATGSLSSIRAEGKTVSATIDGTPITQTAVVTVTVGAFSAAVSTVSASPSSIIAGVESSTITVTALDANGNPISGRTVVIAASGTGNTLTQPVGVTNASGVATGTLASTVAGDKTVSATVNAAAIAQTATVSVTVGGISAVQSTVSASPGSISSDGGATSTITVTARDGSGNPIEGATVVLASNGTGNTITQPAATTNASGVATGTISSTTAQVKTVSATIDGVAVTQTASVTVTPGAVAAGTSSVSANPTAVTAGGVSSIITVTARDANSNVIPGATVVLGATGSGNVISQPAGVTNSSGVATGNVGSTDAGSKTISATINGVAITETASLTVAPAAVSNIVTTVVANPTSITAGGATSTITVTALDDFGNPVPGRSVLLFGTGSNNTVTQPSGVTDANGVAIGSFASNTAETKTISAVVGGQLMNATAEVTVTPAELSTLHSTISASPSSITTDGETSTITVTAKDEFGNPLSGRTVVISASGAGNTVVQPVGLTNASGIATGTLASTVVGSKTVSATIDGQLLLPTTAVTVNPGVVSAATTTVTASPASISADGGSSTITVTARDANSNVIGGASVTLAASGSTNSITQPAGTTNGSGVITGAISSTVAEVKTITATVNGTPITQQPTVTVTPGAVSAVTSTVSADPTAITAGGAGSTITVTARDANSNLISGAAVVLASTGTGNDVTQPVGTTNVSGVATGTVASTVAEAKTVSATIAGIPITQTAAITVNPGAVSAAQSTVAVDPTSIAAGGPTSTITVTARDGNNNPIPGLAVVLAASGTDNTLVQPLAVTDASGVATGTISSTVAESKSISATIAGVGVTQTATLTVTPDAVSVSTSSVIVSDASITTDGETSIVTITVRDGSGNPIGGVSVTLAATGDGNVITQPVGATSVAGVITGTFASTIVGSKTITATAGGVELDQEPVVVVSVGVVSASSSTVSASPTNISADGGASTITVTARDGGGNVIPGATVVLASSGTGNDLTQPVGNSDVNGVATGTIASTVAESKTISATINGTPVTQTASVTVDPGAVSAANSTVIVDPASISADGGSSTITVTARDANNNVIPGLAVTLAATGAGNTLTQPAAVTNASGVATGSLSSTASGAKTITATVDAVPIDQEPVITVTPGAVSAATSTVSASPTSIAAATGTSTITVTARDANNNVIPGRTVVIAATGTDNTITQPLSVTDASGVATGTLASTVAESKTVSATIDAVGVTQTAAVTVTADAPSASLSSAVADPTSIVAGTATSTITVTARDASGNPIPGATVVLSASGVDNTLVQPAVTDLNGVTTGTIASTATGAKTITITVNGVTLDDEPVVTVTPDAVSASQTTVVADPTTLSADGGSSTITITARDQFGNAVPGATVTFVATGLNNTLTQPAAPTDASGVTTGSLSSTGAGTKVVTATVGGVEADQEPSIAVVAGAASTATSLITASPTSITTDGSSTITVQLFDAASNPLTASGGTVALSTDLGALTAVTPVGDGTYTATLTSNVIGTATVTGTLNSVAITDDATVVVSVGAASPLTTLISASLTSMTTDGSATITVQLRDAASNPLTSSSGTVALATTLGSLTAVTPVGDGTYTATLTSTGTGTATVTGTLDAVAITDDATVSVSAGAVSAANSSVNSSDGEQVAGAGTETISVIARDANNNPVPGATVVFSSSGDDNVITQPPGTTDANGEASGTISSTKAESKLITATINGVVIIEQSGVNVIAAAFNAAASSITVSSPTFIAGEESVNVTLTARDEFGNPIAGLNNGYTATGTGNTETQPGALTNVDGEATGSFTSTKAELKTLTGSIAGNTLPATVDVTALPGSVDAATSTVAVDEASRTTDNQTSIVTITVLDVNSNPISGATVTLSATGTGNVITQPVGTTNASGVITGAFRSTIVGAKTITATANATELDQEPVVTVTVGVVSAATTTVSANPTSLEVNTGSSTITVTARDAGGNVIEGATVTLASDGSDNTVVDPAGTTNSSGVAQGSIASTAAEVKTITATVNGVEITEKPTVTFTPGAATHVGFFVHPANGVAGEALQPPIVVRALDSFENVVTSFNGNITVAIVLLTGNPLATLSGTLTVAAENGSAVFDDLSINLAGNGYQLRATSSGLTEGLSLTFDIAAAEELLTATAQFATAFETPGDIRRSGVLLHALSPFPGSSP
jgi:adhesin/invasin